MIQVTNQRASQYMRRKTADESVTSSTTLQNDDHLTFPIAANETWIVECTLHTTFAAAGGLKIAMNGPSGATIRTSAVMDSNGIVPAHGSSGSLAGAIALSPAGATSGLVAVKCIIVNGSTAGNVNLQFAQNVSDVTATTVLANSYLQAVKL